jgi:hypothetical protein
MPQKPKDREPSDLSEKITIRVSKRLRGRIYEQCDRHHLDVAEIVRFFLDAGLGLCEKSGIEAVMIERRAVLDKLRRPGDKRGAGRKS